MGRSGKSFILVIAAILVFSNLTVNASAQVSPSPTPTSIPAKASSSPTASTPTPPPSYTPAPTIAYPKPSVPEFSLSLSTSLNDTIELAIKNQAFAHYTDPSGIRIYMVYNVRASTNHGNWTELFNAEDGYPRPSNSDYTPFLFTVQNSTYTPGLVAFNNTRYIGEFPVNGQIDFQVEAMVGYRSRGPLLEGLIMPYVFNGETSGWSNTQTININPATPTPFSPPRNPPHLEPIDYLLPISIVLVVVIVLLILIYRRHIKPIQNTFSQETLT